MTTPAAVHRERLRTARGPAVAGGELVCGAACPVRGRLAAGGACVLFVLAPRC